MAFKMKKPSITQGTEAHKAALKMKSPMELGKVGDFLKNTAQGKGVAGALVNPIGAMANKLGGNKNADGTTNPPADTVNQDPNATAPTMMKKKSPTKAKGGRATVEKYAKGKKHVGTKRTPEQLRSLAAKAEKAGSTDAAKKMRDKAARAEKEKGRAADYLKKNSPAAMKKAPLKKPLVGKQKNLPEEIKKKILAAPANKKKK
tara:strand:+ start:974 stop:1582 length:609 start_codon:yes stop_codon:yes gene_type:complete